MKLSDLKKNMYKSVKTHKMNLLKCFFFPRKFLKYFPIDYKNT